MNNNFNNNNQNFQQQNPNNYTPPVNRNYPPNYQNTPPVNRNPQMYNRPNPVPNAPVPPYYQYHPPIRKKAPPFTKRDGIFFLLFAIGCFITSDLGFYGKMNLGYTISYFVIFLITTAYFRTEKSKHLVFGSICGLLSLAGSVVFSLYSDTLLNEVLFSLIIGLYIIYVSCLSGNVTNHGSFTSLIHYVVNSTTAFSKFTMPLRSIKQSKNKGGKRFGETVIGICISIPVCVVIIALLSSADDAYQLMMKNIFSSISILAAIIAVAIIITIFVLPFNFAMKNESDYTPGKINAHRIPATITAVFMAMISFIYCTYLFSQLAYFFSGFAGIKPQGISTSEYARRGFFEMCLVTIISIAIIASALLFTKRGKGGKTVAPIKVFSTFIGLFSLLMIGISLSKMVLYIGEYGLTRLRVETSVFMVMLALIAIMAVIHTFAPKVPYMQIIIVFCSTLFIAMCFADIDAVIARYNVDAYKSGEISTVDVFALNDLSDSAVPYMLELTEDKDKDVSMEAAHYLKERVNGDNRSAVYRFYDKDNKSKALLIFKYYNKSEAEALNAVKKSKVLMSAINSKTFDDEYYAYSSGMTYEEYLETKEPDSELF